MSHSARWIEARLRAGQTAIVPLSGLSMSPELGDGDRLEVVPLAGTPRPGEVVLTTRGGRLVTHRLVAIDGAQAITRGDACGKDDPPVPLSSVIGRVVRVRRRKLWHRMWRGERCR
jgi:phage repressor protein C with HTH and peptisase S24 domain